MIFDTHLSREAGRHDNFLAEVKHHCPEKYAWLKQHGIRAYDDRSNEIRQQLGVLYYQLKEAPFGAFSRWVKDHPGQFRNGEAFSRFIQKVAFTADDKPLTWQTFKKAERILNETPTTQPR